MKKIILGMVVVLMVMSGCSGGGGSNEAGQAASKVKVSCMDLNAVGTCTTATGAMMSSMVYTTAYTEFESGSISVAGLVDGTSALPTFNMVVSNNTGTVFEGYWIMQNKPAGVDVGWCVGPIPNLADGETYTFETGCGYMSYIPLNVPLSVSVMVFDRNSVQLPDTTDPQGVYCGGPAGSQGPDALYYETWTATHDMSNPLAIGTDHFMYVP